MKLFSALEDLQERTLQAVNGPLYQLTYLLSLREASGEFAHWGLEHKYGAERARQAIKSSFYELRKNVLRSDLRSLLEEGVSAEELGRGALQVADLQDAHLSLIFECLAEAHHGSKKAA